MTFGLYLLFLGGFVFPLLFKKLMAADRETDTLSVALCCGAAVLWLTAAIVRPAALSLALLCVAIAALGVIVVRTRARGTPTAGAATPEA